MLNFPMKNIFFQKSTRRGKSFHSTLLSVISDLGRGGTYEEELCGQVKLHFPTELRHCSLPHSSLLSQDFLHRLGNGCDVVADDGKSVLTPHK